MEQKTFIFSLPDKKELNTASNGSPQTLQVIPSGKKSPNSQQKIFVKRKKKLNEQQYAYDSISPQNSRSPNGINTNNMIFNKSPNKEKRLLISQANKNDSKSLKQNNLLKDQLEEKKTKLSLNEDNINNHNNEKNLSSAKTKNEFQSSTIPLFSQQFWKKQDEKFSEKREFMKVTIAEELEIEQQEFEWKEQQYEQQLLLNQENSEDSKSHSEQPKINEPSTSITRISPLPSRRVSHILEALSEQEHEDYQSHESRLFEEDSILEKKSRSRLSSVVEFTSRSNSQYQPGSSAAQSMLSIKGVRKNIPIFTSDTVMNSAIIVLMYKTPDLRNSGDINVLTKATAKINFFHKIDGKVLLIQNICKAMQFQYVPKGKIVFYQGDFADKFFITLKGKVAILVQKRAQDLIQEESMTNRQWMQLSKEKQKLTIRARLLKRSLFKAISLINNCLFFFTALQIKAKVLKTLPQTFPILKLTTSTNVIASANPPMDQSMTLSSQPSKRARNSMYEIKYVTQDMKEKIMAFTNEEIDKELISHRDDKIEEYVEFKRNQKGIINNSSIYVGQKRDRTISVNSLDCDNNQSIGHFKLPSKQQQFGKSSSNIISLKQIESVDQNESQHQYNSSHQNFNSSVNSFMHLQMLNRQSSYEKEMMQKGLFQRNSIIKENNTEGQEEEEDGERRGGEQNQYVGSQEIDEDEENSENEDGTIRKKNRNNKKYQPIQPSNSYQDQISNYKNVSVFNRITYKTEKSNKLIENANNLNQNPVAPQIPSIPLVSPESSPTNQITKELLEEKNNNAGTFTPTPNTLRQLREQQQMQSEFKQVENIQIAKKLQDFSEIILKKRKQIKSVVDIFVNSTTNSTFKIYQEIRQSVESKVKGLNLETLENGAHFFKNNTFKYNLANLSGDGYVFGEIGILNKKPRSATVVCLEDSYFGTLSAKKYEQILAKQEKDQLAKKRIFIMDTFRTSETNGQSNSLEKISKVTYFFHKRKYQAGEIVFKEGEQSKYIYLIKKGEIELEKEVEIPVNNDKELMRATVRVAKLTKKEYFGDCDLIFDRDRYFTAISSTSSSVYFCEAMQFMKIVEEAKIFMEMFQQRIKSRDQYRLQVIEEAKKTRNFVKDLKNFQRITKANLLKQRQQSPRKKSPMKSHSNSVHSQGKNSQRNIIIRPEIDEDKEKLHHNNNIDDEGETKKQSGISSRKTSDVANSIEQALMTKAAFYSPRIPFYPQAISSDNENLLQALSEYSPSKISTLKCTRNPSFSGNSQQEQANAIVFPNFPEMVMKMKKQSEGEQIGKKDEESPSKRITSNSFFSELKQKMISKVEGPSTSRRITEESRNQLNTQSSKNSSSQLFMRENSSKTIGAESIQPETVKHQIKLESLKVLARKPENIKGIQKQTFQGECDSVLEGVQTVPRKIVTRWGSVQERIGARDSDEDLKLFRQEVCQSTERLRILRQGNKANGAILRKHQKKHPKETVHDQFMNIREICTVNDLLFKKEEKVFEQREKAQREMIQNMIYQPKKHHHHSLTFISTIYNQLANMTDKQTFSQTNSLNPDLLTLHSYTTMSTNNNTNNNNNAQSKGNFSNTLPTFTQNQLNRPTNTPQTANSMRETFNNPKSQNIQNQFYLNKTTSKPTHQHTKSSTCLKTASLFLYNEQGDCFKNLQPSKDAPEKNTINLSDINGNVLEAISKESFHRIDTIYNSITSRDISPHTERTSTKNPYSYNSTNHPSQQLSTNTLIRQKTPVTHRIHCEKPLENLQEDLYKLNSARRGQSQQQQSSSTSSQSQHICFDDNKVEKVEAKRFDIKRHYLNTNKITVVNHMQRPMLFKKEVQLGSRKGSQ